MRPIIKNFCFGRASNEGNGMVGGKWWGCSHLGYRDIPISDVVPDGEGKVKERLDYAVEWLTEKFGDDCIRVEAYFSEGADESVGLASGYCDLDDVLDLDEYTLRMLRICPFLTKKEQKAVIDAIYSLAEEDEDYELYEPDYPEE